MARFRSELPTELIKTFQGIEVNTEKMMAEMTRAGADVVADNIQQNAPNVLRPYVKKSKTYRTPTDDGINTQAYVSGYIPFSNPNRRYFARRNGRSTMVYKSTEGVPAEFLANIYEFGRHGYPFPKHPFLRKSFRKAQIEKAMLDVQKKYIKED